MRVIGIAGGSMVRVRDHRLVDVGPRSAHIAGLPYAAFANPEDIVEPRIELFQPKPDDPGDYVAVRVADGTRYAITNTCAANVLGYAKPGLHAYGNPEAAQRAMAALADWVGKSIEDTARLRRAIEVCSDDDNFVGAARQDANDVGQLRPLYWLFGNVLIVTTSFGEHVLERRLTQHVVPGVSPKSGFDDLARGRTVTDVLGNGAEPGAQQPRYGGNSCARLRSRSQSKHVTRILPAPAS
jgi:hypothetical protein